MENLLIMGIKKFIGKIGLKLGGWTTVNETPVNPYDTITECILEDLSFSADINLIDYNLIWDFGDGTTSTDNPVSHYYENHGFFVASLTVTTEEPPCGGSSTTNTSYFYIDLRRTVQGLTTTLTPSPTRVAARATLHSTSL